MTPTFNPGPNPFGPPPIYLGALGPRLTRATAEVADGLLVMPFGSKRFLHEATMPAVREGLAAAGRDAARFRGGAGDHRVGRDETRPRRRAQAAGVLRVDAGYRRCWTCTAGAICSPNSTRCPSRAAGRRWARLIDDDILHTIAACGTPAEVAAHIRDRVDGVSDRICLYQPGPIAVEALAEIVDALGS